MKTELVPLECLEPDPDNIRRTFIGLEDLARTIEEYGLLQNLVVRPPVGGHYRIISGERRYRALLILRGRNAQLGRKPWDGRVPCVLYDGESHRAVLAQIVENVQRSAVPTWHLGHRYIELCDAYGITQGELASRIGLSPGSISLTVQIARGLHPSVVRKLDQLTSAKLSRTDLGRIAKLLTPDGDPDEDAQHEKLDSIVQRKRRKYKDRTALPEHKMVLRRYDFLKKNPYRPEKQIYIDAFLNYLSGRTRRLELP